MRRIQRTSEVPSGSSSRGGAAARGAGAGIWDIELENRQLRLCRRTRELLGFDPDGPEEVSQDEWLAVVHPDDLPTTLAAIGQMGSIWTGGGTIVAWSSLVAVAGFAGVSVTELVRRNFFPVVVGLLVSTLVALLIW